MHSRSICTSLSKINWSLVAESNYFGYKDTCFTCYSNVINEKPWNLARA